MLNRAFSIYNLYHNIVNIIIKLVFLSTKFDKLIFYFLHYIILFLTIKVIKSYFIIIYVYKERKSNHLFYKIKVQKQLFL